MNHGGQLEPNISKLYADFALKTSKLKNLIRFYIWLSLFLGDLFTIATVLCWLLLPNVTNFKPN